MDYKELYEGQKVCCTCMYYFQHYHRSGKGYLPVGWGHCTYPRIKPRRPDEKCERWQTAETDPVTSQ